MYDKKDGISVSKSTRAAGGLSFIGLEEPSGTVVNHKCAAHDESK